MRERLPQATIITFWHIPWPNPESFGICPWRREILQGMLGSTILGFHTRFHCKNFIETVDRYLEARIEHEYSTISYQDKETLVESYPISIEWPSAEPSATWPSVAECRRRVFERLELPPDTCLARRRRSLRLHQGHPRAPARGASACSRSAPSGSAASCSCRWRRRRAATLDEYRSLRERIERVSDASISASAAEHYQPIHLLVEHHERDAVNELFRAANMCVVTSLHDGMNLVSKEFVAARDDEQGVLILSRFAGAARELTDALIVNPYHVEESRRRVAPRGHDAGGRAARTHGAACECTVREFNVYRWAGRMLADAGRWRMRARIEARVQRYMQPLG